MDLARRLQPDVLARERLLDLKSVGYRSAHSAPQARRLLGRGVIIVADQAVSSVSNFALMVVAGRTLGPSGLGVVAIGFALGIGVVATSRAMTGETALVYGPSDERGPLATGLLISAIASAGLAVVATLADQSVSSAMMVLAVGIAFVVAQDTLRYRSFSERRPDRALVSDLVWLVAQSIVLLVGWRLNHASPALVLGAWVAGAAVGTAALARRSDLTIRFKHAISWLRRTRALSAWLGAQVLVSQAISQLLVIAVGAIAGFAALGGLRAGQTLMAPLALNLSALPPLVLPLIGLAEAPDRLSVKRSTLRLTVLGTTLGGIYAGLLLLAGSVVLPAVFGPDFEVYVELLTPLAVVALFLGAAMGPGIGTRALGAGRAVFNSQLIASVVGIVAIPVLTLGGGALGAAWGLAAQSVALALASHWAFRRTLQRAGKDKE